MGQAVTRSEFVGNYGPSRGGSGHQFNGTTFFFGDGERLLRGGRDPLRMARDHLDRLNRQFVEPPGYAKAQDVLEHYHCVILLGASGVGKRAAGQVLLRRLGGEDTVVQDVFAGVSWPRGSGVLWPQLGFPAGFGPTLSEVDTPTIA